MSWHVLPELVAEYSADDCSAGEPSAPWKSSRMPEKCSSDASGTVCSPCSRSGTTSEHSTAARGVERWMSSLADSRARRSLPLLEDETSLLTCGPRCAASCSRRAHVSCSRRTSRDGQSGERQMTLNGMDTDANTRGSDILRRALRLLGTDGGWLPRPTAKANQNCQSMSKWPSCRNFQALFGTGVIHPEVYEWMMIWPIAWTALKPLEMDRFRRWLRLHGACSGVSGE